MPRPKASTAAESVESEGPSEPEQPVESDERIDLDEDNDPEEIIWKEDLDVENANGAGADETKLEDGDEKRKHAELLARPPHGSEVYIGGIPHDVSQEDLKGFCESVGEVTEVWTMKGKDSSENKGFAFVTFRSVELASKAIDELNKGRI